MAPHYQERPGGGWLIIGYGNSLRGDDGVGPRVAELVGALGLPGLATLACDLLTPELADPISRAGSVVFVDASLEVPRVVRLRQITPAESSQILAHAADPRTMLALARDVFGHAPEAWWLTIPAENLAVGSELTELARRGTEEAVERIKGLARNQAETS